MGPIQKLTECIIRLEEEAPGTSLLGCRILLTAIQREQEGSPLSFTEIMKDMGTHSSTLSQIIDNLGSHGRVRVIKGERKVLRKGDELISTSLDPMDRRRRLIHLTPKGKAVARQLKDIMET